MSRRVFVLFAAFALVAVSFISGAPVVEALNTGCSAFAGLYSGFLQESDVKDNLLDFDTGATIQAVSIVESGFPNAGDPYQGMQMTVQGADASFVTLNGASMSYTIPKSQSYRIRLENVGGDPVAGTVDANVAASCGGGGGGPAPQWSGNTDGRLNPDPAESYSIFCGSGVVDVYVTFNGQGNLLARISQNDLSVLNRGQNRQVGTNNGPLIVTRLTDTDFRFAGNNGNRSPEFGQKDADLAPCRLNLPAPPPFVPVIQVTYGILTATPRPTATPVPDLDNDRLSGLDDLCPTYRPPAAVFATVRGCADTDGDGFVNPYMGNPQTYVVDDRNPEAAAFVDECPTVFGQGNNGNGCPDPASATTVVISTTVVDQNALPQTIVNVLFPNIISQWVSVSLQGDTDPCTLNPADSSVTTSNYLYFELCEPRVFFTPNTSRVRYRGPGTSYGRYDGAAIPSGASVTVTERTANNRWIKVTSDQWYSGWIQSADGTFNVKGDDGDWTSNVPVWSP